jgi:uncharacterized protein (DUF2235 family)
MAKNIVVFCDGTNNKFGKRNTNVVKLLQALENDPASQAVYYDPGVGTIADPWWMTWLTKKVATLLDLAFATSFNRQVQEAYVYVMNTWEPGDRIFLFGFSRGAYTARVVGALLHDVGLLPRGADNLVPYALRLLRYGPADVRQEFRNTFARNTSHADKRCPIHFLGVWDTVSSVGWVWNQAKHAWTKGNPSIAKIRHAASIDERRAFYRSNRVGAPVTGEAQDRKEVWFAGAHSDIGGGYSDDDTLSHCSLDWMIAELQADGVLRFDPAKVPAPQPNAWEGKKHQELRNPAWWICEIFPKTRFFKSINLRLPILNLFRSRTLEEGDLIHESALKRMRAKKYSPWNVSRAFCKHVESLPSVPPVLGYFKDAPAGAAAPKVNLP